MKFQILEPPSNLAHYVQYFWILEDDKPYTHRSLADGCVEMIFHYQGAFDEIDVSGRKTCASSVIQGTSSSFQIYSCSTSFGIFGVYFYPYAIPSLFKVPSSELSNQMPDLFSFLGNEGQVLEHQIFEARSTTDRVKVMSGFLQQRLANVEASEIKFQQIIKSLIHSKAPMNIQRQAEQCFVSRRQFERKFVHNAGFSPQKYYRILRFQQATEAYHQKEKSLTQIALDCGYYDQAHFTNEFFKFSGYSPKAYFTGKVSGVEWRDC